MFHTRFLLVAGLLTLPLTAAAQSGERNPEDHTLRVTGRLGEGVNLRRADERFTLQIRGRMQVRATVAERVNDDPQTEVMIRRLRLVLTGNAWGPTIQYYFQFGFSNLDMEPDLRVPVRDAYATWNPIRDLSLRVGQMKVPYGRQRVVSSSALQFADRSVVTGEFNLDRDVGAQLFSKDLFGLGGRLAYNLGVFGGDGRNRLSDQFGLLWAARVQVNPFGAFDDYVEADLDRSPRPRLSLGASVGYNQNTRRTRSTTGDTLTAGFDLLHVGADLMFKWHGLSVEAEWYYRQSGVDQRVTPRADGTTLTEYARSGMGWYAQAGMMFTDHFEAVARYGETRPRDGADPTLHRATELGGGLNYYLSRHDLKLQADFFWLYGDAISEGRWQSRLQAQVYF